MSENCSAVDDCGSDEGSALSINEKGRNKRKFLSDLSMEIPVEVSSLSLTEFPRYEIMDEKFRDALNELGSMMERSEDTVEEQDTEEFQQSDWDDPVASQLEELLSNNLFSTFCTAVTKIVEHGYTEEVAEWAVLNTSLVHGSSCAVSNVMDSALALLKKEKEFNKPKHPVFDGLQNLVDYTLLEMIYVLQEVRPSMTVSEAMWCLLISDLNLVNACVAEGGAAGGSSSQEAPGDSETPTQSKSETSVTSQSKDSDNSGSATQIMPQDKGSQPKSPVPATCAQLTIKQCSCESGKENSLFCQEAKGKLAAIVKEHIQASSQAIGMDEKSGCRGKCLSIGSKRDMLRQKAFQFEKSYKGRLSKGSFKAKVAAWGSMVFDKKSQPGSSSAAMKGAPTKLATSAGTEGSNDPSSNSPSLVPASSVKDIVFALPALNAKPLQGKVNVSDTPKATGTEATCGSKGKINVSDTPKATATEATCGSKGEVNVSDTAKAVDYYASIPYDETLQKHVPEDDKDEAILMLVPHKQDIEKEMQGWKEWANEKVMQVARRLGKDQAELKMLRQEKEEIEKYKKEKQTLEEGTLKRLSEMESALTNATGQIEVANSNIRRLEEENNMLKSDLEAAKAHAAKTSSNLKAALLREQETLKKLQSWDTEKSLVQEQLTNLKREIAVLNNRHEKSKERKDQFKALWKQAEKEKLKAQKQFESLRRKLEEETAVMKAESDKVKLAAEKEMQKCEDDIKNLQNTIAALRLESNRSKIAALNMGYGSYLPDLPGSQLPKVTKRLAAFQDNFSEEPDVKPERECVMCMTDEISVVFVPCAHQVFCGDCSALHEKQGMNDCPSCRTPIKKRVSVIYRPDS